MSGTIKYDPAAILAAASQLEQQKNTYLDASDNISQQYKALDAVSEGAANQAQNEYQSKAAVSRQKLTELVTLVKNLTNKSLEDAQATDSQFASRAGA